MKHEFLPRNKQLRPFSTKLRNEATPEERILWFQYLRSYPIQFNRQRIIGGYIADFYCDRARLVIEIDGAHHFTSEAIAYDRERTKYFRAMEIEELRFTNHEVRQKFGQTCKRIDQAVKRRLERV